MNLVIGIKKESGVDCDLGGREGFGGLFGRLDLRGRGGGAVVFVECVKGGVGSGFLEEEEYSLTVRSRVGALREGCEIRVGVESEGAIRRGGGGGESSWLIEEDDELSCWDGMKGEGSCWEGNDIGGWGIEGACRVGGSKSSSEVSEVSEL